MNVGKKIVLCLVGVISASGLARAEAILVLEGPVDEFQKLNAKFNFDSKLGRAWVDVEQVDSEFQPNRNTVAKTVDGLSYDSKAKEVVYQRGGSRIVCAQGKSFLGESTARATGNCPLVVSYEQRTVDDGVRPRTQTFAKVTLNPEIQPSQTSQKQDAKK